MDYTAIANKIATYVGNQLSRPTPRPINYAYIRRLLKDYFGPREDRIFDLEEAISEFCQDCNLNDEHCEVCSLRKYKDPK